MLFDEFYTTYRPYVERVIWAIVGSSSPDQVEDLVQDTFLRAWKAYERMEPYAVHAWIARIARNVAIDSLRSLRAQQRHTYAWDEEVAGQLPDTNSAAQAVYSGEVDLIKQVLACMRSKDREVLLLASQGYKTGEIAARLDLNYGRCKQRVMRARARFRAQYLALCG
jgi:RNA polymerase sigma factor (sigma-70 family)